MKKLTKFIPLFLITAMSALAAEKKALLVVSSNSPKIKAEKVKEFKSLCEGKLSAKLVSVVDWDDAIANSEVKVLANDASVLAKARQVQAPLIIKVALSDLSETVKTISKSNQHDLSGSVSLLKLSSSVSVSKSADGVSLYGGVVAATDRIAVSKTLEMQTSNRLYSLFNQLAESVAKIVETKWNDSIGVKLESDLASFKVNANVPGVTVKIDGLVAPQSNGAFKATKGIHNLSVEREWFKTFEGTVFVSEGGTIDVTMEMSSEGLAKFKSVEKFNLALKREDQQIDLDRQAAEAKIAIAKEQSKAEATSKVLEAEGKKSFLEKSKVSIEGEINELNINTDKDDEVKDSVNQIINVTK